MLANTYSFYSRFLSDFMFEMCFVQSVINIKQMTLQFYFLMWASNRKSFIWRNTSPVQTLRKMSGSRTAGRSMECS